MRNIFIVFMLLTMKALAATPELNDTKESFVKVVRNAYVLSHAKPEADLPEIEQNLEDEIERISDKFETARQNEDGHSNAQNCHIVCAMLGKLLCSGNKDLVNLYYYIVDSYNQNQPFLKQITGYDWDRTGSRQATPSEKQVYEAGQKMRAFTDYLNHPSAHQEFKWTDGPNDGWFLHQAWTSIAAWQVDLDDYHGGGHMWTGMLYQPLWAFFEKIAPDYVWPHMPALRDTATNPKTRQAFLQGLWNLPKDLRDAIWLTCWKNTGQEYDKWSINISNTLDTMGDLGEIYRRSTQPGPDQAQYARKYARARFEIKSGALGALAASLSQEEEEELKQRVRDICSSRNSEGADLNDFEILRFVRSDSDLVERIIQESSQHPMHIWREINKELMLLVLEKSPELPSQSDIDICIREFTKFIPQINKYQIKIQREVDVCENIKQACVDHSDESFLWNIKKEAIQNIPLIWVNVGTPQRTIDAQLINRMLDFVMKSNDIDALRDLRHILRQQRGLEEFDRDDINQKLNEMEAKEKEQAQAQKHRVTMQAAIQKVRASVDTKMREIETALAQQEKQSAQAKTRRCHEFMDLMRGLPTFLVEGDMEGTQTINLLNKVERLFLNSGLINSDLLTTSIRQKYSPVNNISILDPDTYTQLINYIEGVQQVDAWQEQSTAIKAMPGYKNDREYTEIPPLFEAMVATYRRLNDITSANRFVALMNQHIKPDIHHVVIWEILRQQYGWV